MGATVSVYQAHQLPQQIDKSLFHQLTEDKYSEQAYDYFINSDGMISLDRFIDIVSSYDCYISHEWGIDETGRSTHKRVKIMHDYFQKNGLFSYYDDGQLTAPPPQQELSFVNATTKTNGAKTNINTFKFTHKERIKSLIDKSQCVILFITEKYLQKLLLPLENDISIEFHESLSSKSLTYIVPVIIDKNVNVQNYPILSAFKNRLTFYLYDFEYIEEQRHELYEHLLQIIVPLKDGGNYQKKRFEFSATLEGRLYNWFKKNTHFNHVTSQLYSSYLSRSGIVSMSKLWTRIIVDNSYLIQLGIPKDDAEIIYDALKNDIEYNFNPEQIVHIDGIINKSNKHIMDNIHSEQRETKRLLDISTQTNESIEFFREDQLSFLYREVYLEYMKQDLFKRLQTHLSKSDKNQQQEILKDITDSDKVHEMRESQRAANEEINAIVRITYLSQMYEIMLAFQNANNKLHTIAIETMDQISKSGADSAAKLLNILLNSSGGAYFMLFNHEQVYQFLVERRPNRVIDKLNAAAAIRPSGIGDARGGDGGGFNGSLGYLLLEICFICHRINLSIIDNFRNVKQLVLQGVVKAVMFALPKVYLFDISFSRLGSIDTIREQCSLDSFRDGTLSLPRELLITMRWLCQFNYIDSDFNSFRNVKAFIRSGALILCAEIIKHYAQFEDAPKSDQVSEMTTTDTIVEVPISKSSVMIKAKDDLSIKKVEIPSKFVRFKTSFDVPNKPYYERLTGQPLKKVRDSCKTIQSSGFRHLMVIDAALESINVLLNLSKNPAKEVDKIIKSDQDFLPLMVILLDRFRDYDEIIVNIISILSIALRLRKYDYILEKNRLHVVCPAIVTIMNNHRYNSKYIIQLAEAIANISHLNNLNSNYFQFSSDIPSNKERYGNRLLERILLDNNHQIFNTLIQLVEVHCDDHVVMKPLLVALCNIAFCGKRYKELLTKDCIIPSIIVNDIRLHIAVLKNDFSRKHLSAPFSSMKNAKDKELGLNQCPAYRRKELIQIGFTVLSNIINVTQEERPKVANNNTDSSINQMDPSDFYYINANQTSGTNPVLVKKNRPQNAIEELHGANMSHIMDLYYANVTPFTPMLTTELISFEVAKSGDTVKQSNINVNSEVKSFSMLQQQANIRQSNTHDKNATAYEANIRFERKGPPKRLPYRLQLLNLGIGEVILDYLVEFDSYNDLGVVKSVLVLLSKLMCRSKPLTVQRLVSLGLCEKLLPLLTRFKDDSELYILALQVVRILAIADNDSDRVIIGSISRLQSLGICDYICENMKQHCCTNNDFINAKRWPHLHEPFICKVCIESCEIVHELLCSELLQERKARSSNHLLTSGFRKAGFVGLIFVKPPEIAGDIHDIMGALNPPHDKTKPSLLLSAVKQFEGKDNIIVANVLSNRIVEARESELSPPYAMLGYDATALYTNNNSNNNNYNNNNTKNNDNNSDVEMKGDASDVEARDEDVNIRPCYHNIEYLNNTSNNKRNEIMKNLFKHFDIIF
eukprot:gene8471-11453_t